MCGFCFAAELDDPCAVKGPGSLQSDIPSDPGSIGFAIPDNTSSTETITIGGTRDETLEVTGDKDWFRIDLTDGDAIQIDLFGLDHDSGNSLGELVDPYVRIRDASGNVLAENDDIVFATILDSRLVFQATDTATYFIEVDSYASSYAGDYRLQVAATTPPPPPPPASPVEAMQTNFTLNTNDPVLVYFAQAGDTYSYNGDTYTATGMNAYEQGQLFSVFEGVEQFIDVDFQITTDRNAADLEWATDTLPSSGGGTLLGFFFFPSSNGNGGFGVLNNNSSSFPSWNSTPGGTLDTGGFMYGVAVHELGHGLGLGHPHDGGGGSDVMQGVTSSSSRGNFGLNQAPFTAMSYNEGWNGNPAGFASSVAATGHGATFGALDIAALQNMYGANTSHAGGNDVYDLFDTQATGSGSGYYATWDTGGIDEFRYSGNRDATIDLRAATLAYENGGGGFMSYVDGIIAGRTIANGVVIENATGGSGDDDLIGNDANNLLIGNAGDDTMTGGAGVDTFEFDFGDGFDTIADFEIGTDLIDFLGLGIAFSDLTITDNSGNAQITYDFTTSGQITLTGITSASLTLGDFLLDVASGPITGTENADDLDGTAGDDEILGLGGNDTINALAGNDSIDAGAGDDTIVYTSGEDTIDGGAGNDWLDLRGVTGDANFSLLTSLAIDGTPVDVQNVENILLSDVGNTIQDDNADNTIIGGAGNDTFSILNGNDSLDGGDGVDALFLNDGGVTPGPDYVIDLVAGTATGSNGDVKEFAGFESVSGGFGSNTFLGAAVTDVVQGYDGDDLFTLEDGDDTAFSGSGASTLSGGAGDDSLSAGAGNDTLDGGTGNDTLEGGADADLFAFAMGDGEDIITDFEVGTDLIDLAGQGIAFSDLSIVDAGGVATVTYDLVTTGVITLTGVTAAELTQASFLTDPEAPPPPTLPQVTGTSGNDNVDGTSADEELLGLAGNDILNGRGGEDVHAGGSGDDRYYLDSAGDTVVEQAGEGYDRVYHSQSFTLADNVEAGNTRGLNAMDITGNGLANWITGNDETNTLRGGDGNDRLIGRGGADTLNGDAGNDVLNGGAGADVFAFDAATGTDIIQDFELGTDVIDVTSLGVSYADLTIVDSGTRAIVIWDDPGNVGTRGIVVVENTSSSDLLLSSFVTTFGNAQPAIIGTSGNDDLTGSQIGDELQGLGGDDRLDGAGDADTLVGGTGDDRYDVEDTGDLIVELAGEGLDRVYSSVSYVLSDHVENLTATGDDDVALTGNSGINWLTGNAGANVLSAAAGNDRLIGREGADTLEGGTGNDIMEGGADADVFVFNVGDGTDTIQDFQDGVDLIDVSSLGISFGDLRIVDSGTNAIVFYDESDPADRGLIVVNNQTASTFAADDFVFGSATPPLPPAAGNTIVLDFNDGVEINDGDTILDGTFTTSFSNALFGAEGQLVPREYGEATGADPDLEAYNSVAATVQFSKTDGGTFDFESVSMANFSSNSPNPPANNLANSVRVDGYRDEVVVESMVIDLTFQHVNHQLNWTGIDSIEFDPIGGGNVDGQGWFSMDDLVFVI